MERVEIIRDCDAIEIPAGKPVILEKGIEVFITQSLGGTYTLQVPAYGGLFTTARGFAHFLRSELRTAPSEALGWRSGAVMGVAYLTKPGGGPGFCGNVRVYPSVGIATAWFANRMQVSERKIGLVTDGVDRNWFVR